MLVVAAYGLILSERDTRAGRGRVHQRARLAAAALARRRADPARAARRRHGRRASRSCRWMRASTPAPCSMSSRVPISARETAATLEARLAAPARGALVVRCCAARRRRSARADAATGGRRDVRGEDPQGRSDDRLAARPQTAIDRQVRAFDPSPGASTALGRARRSRSGARDARVDPVARSAARHGARGRARAGIVVACGEGRAARSKELQPRGGRRMSAAAFAAGRGSRAGARFGADSARRAARCAKRSG